MTTDSAAAGGENQPASDLEGAINDQRKRVEFFRAREMPAMTINAEYALAQMEARRASAPSAQ